MVRAPYPNSLTSSSTACRITCRERSILGSTAGFGRARAFCGLDDGDRRGPCCSGTGCFRTRARRAICRGIGLEQLDEISRWVFQQDLLAACALNHVAAKATACRFELGDRSVQLPDEEVDSVPTSGLLFLSRRHFRAAADARRRPSEIDVHVLSR